MKTEPDNQIAVPARWANDEDWMEPVAKMPAVLKPFAGKTIVQFLEKYIPHEKMGALAGAVYGVIDLEISIPEWAKKSSRQFWKHYFGDGQLDFKSIEDFGVMVKIVESYGQGYFSRQKTASPQSKLGKFISGISFKAILHLIQKKIVSRLSDEEISLFYAGRVRGGKIIEKMQHPEYLEMVKRAKVYLIIAVAWKEIEGFKTHAERERWLRSLIEEKEPQFNSETERERWLEGNEGKKFIAKRLSSREFYDIFQIIELPGAEPGRPKKSETRPEQIEES